MFDTSEALSRLVVTSARRLMVDPAANTLSSLIRAVLLAVQRIARLASRVPPAIYMERKTTEERKHYSSLKELSGVDLPRRCQQWMRKRRQCIQPVHPS